MNRGSKWLDQLSSKACITDAARVAIPRRLESVFYYVPLVLHHADDSDEYIHQLRVSTRRAQAALSMTSFVLPAKSLQNWKRILRDFRQAAGAVRDHDVMLQRLQRTDNDYKLLSSSDQTAVVEWLKSRRLQELDTCLTTLQRTAEQKPCRRWQQLVSEVQWTSPDSEPLAHKVFETELQRQGKKFSRSGLLVLDSKVFLEDITVLHRLRISGKRLRYTIELASGVFEQRLRPLYEVISTVQNRLGRVNDHAIAQQFFASHQSEQDSAALQSNFSAMAEWESEALETELAAWSAWWNRSRLELFWDQWQEVMGETRWSSKKRA